MSSSSLCRPAPCSAAHSVDCRIRATRRVIGGIAAAWRGHRGLAGPNARISQRRGPRAPCDEVSGTRQLSRVDRVDGGGEEAALMRELAEGSVVSVRGSDEWQGFGLFVTRDVEEGAVVLSVEKANCLVYCDDGSIDVPSGGTWPLTTEAIEDFEDLPWYLIQALAVLDCMDGNGSAVFERYCRAFLPRPEDVVFPMCMTEEELALFQHPDLAERATLQGEQLASIFPDLATRPSPGQPTRMEWAFACVRSRAFRLVRAGEDGETITEFCFAPFLDIANHHHDPNCDFRISQDGTRVEMFARRPIRAGDEATISYTGVSGYTNQRLMAQYGFVPVGGNPGDRVTFPKSLGIGYEDTVKDYEGPRLCGVRLQRVLGDDAWVAMVTGADPRLAATVRSLPLVEGDSGEEAVATEGELQLARSMAEDVEEQLRDMVEGPAGTTLEADLSELARLGAQGRAAAGAEGRRWWALAYRSERKALLLRAAVTLRLYAGELQRMLKGSA